MKFFSLEFFQKLADEVNAKPEFKEGIGDFDGSFIWWAEDLDWGIYFEIKDGKVGNVHEADEDEEANFKMEGSYDPAWIEIGKGNLFLREAMLSGQMTVEGSITELAAYLDGLAIFMQTMAALPKEF